MGHLIDYGASESRVIINLGTLIDFGASETMGYYKLRASDRLWGI